MKRKELLTVTIIAVLHYVMATVAFFYDVAVLDDRTIDTDATLTVWERACRGVFTVLVPFWHQTVLLVHHPLVAIFLHSVVLAIVLGVIVYAIGKTRAKPQSPNPSPEQAEMKGERKCLKSNSMDG